MEAPAIPAIILFAIACICMWRATREGYRND